MRAGASDFIPKPVVPDVLTAAILAALERAGRADHAQCAAIVSSAPASTSSTSTSDGAAAPAPNRASSPSPDSASIHLTLDALRIGQRNGFLIANKRRDLQDVPFAAFLRCAAERARGSSSFLPKRELGMVRRPEIRTD